MKINLRKRKLLIQKIDIRKNIHRKATKMVQNAKTTSQKRKIHYENTKAIKIVYDTENMLKIYTCFTLVLNSVTILHLLSLL